MEDIEAKQNFLCQEVLNKGYNGQEFEDYLAQNVPDFSLETWSIEQLKTVVSQFCQTHQIKETTQQPVQDEPNPAPVEEEKTEKKEDEEVKTEQKDLGNVVYSEKIQCLKIEETELSKCENLQITLSFPEKVEGGLFTKSYVTYLVTTLPFEHKVRKRYSDFEWLRQTLSNFFPGSMIPPMPKKNYNDRFNEMFISKRMRSLEKFMQALAVNPLIKSSQILYDFLTIENDGEWNDKKNQYNKMRIPTELKDIKTLTGEIQLDVSKEKETYFQNIKDNCYLNESLMKKLNGAYKTLIDNLGIVSVNMQEISEIWEQLHKNSEDYFENEKVTETYNIMSKLMKGWADSEKRQVELLNLEIREYFKYIKNEFRAMKELEVKCDNAKSIFYKSDKALITKKEGLFEKQDHSKWELDKDEIEENRLKLVNNKEYAFSKMLSRETNEVLRMKQKYGYFLNSVIDEYERIRDLNGERHKNRIISYSKKNTDIITDLHVSLADLISYFSVKQG